MILDCNVLCYQVDKLGIGDEIDSWQSIAIDLSRVVAIKNNGEGTEFSGPNKAVLYVSPNDYFVTDLKYDNAVSIWKQSKDR